MDTVNVSLAFTDYLGLIFFSVSFAECLNAICGPLYCCRNGELNRYIVIQNISGLDFGDNFESGK